MESFSAYMPMDRRQAIAENKALPNRAMGALLFVDISGFGRLTADLLQEYGLQRGAEEVLRRINPMYAALIDILHSYRGSVISFAGDAITCWLDYDDGHRAVTCALAMQQTMKQYDPLAVKTAVVFGSVRRFLVGDPSIQIIDIVAGEALDRMAAAGEEAQKGELVVGDEIVIALKQKLDVAARRVHQKSGQRFAVVSGLRSPVKETPWPVLPHDMLTKNQIKRWLLPTVYERLQGDAHLLSELRPVVVLFLKFEGLKYDADETVGQKLNDYIVIAQTILARYEGFLLQLTTGDKGSYFYAAFGAPLAHDDDADRALAAALELRTLSERQPYITSVQIGVSKGQMWAGAYGGPMRRTYGSLGNETNMAARLMMQADPNQILATSYVVAASQRFHFEPLMPIVVKDQDDLIPVFKVRGERRLPPRFTTQLVGRQDILDEMIGYLEVAAAGQGQSLRLEGEAGIGKSHLAAVFCQEAAERGWQTAVGRCESVQTSAYQPWRPIIRAWLELPDSAAEGQIEQLTVILERRNPDWLLRLPLLSDLLGLPIPDDTTTEALDPQSRQEALFALVVEMVRMQAQKQPLLLLLEDVHWLDEGSAGLTLALARAIHQIPIILLLTQRPPLPQGSPILPDLDSLTSHRRLVLPELSPVDAAALVEQKLSGALSPLALKLIQAKARGNPFFIAELTQALREAGQLKQQKDGRWALSKAIIVALRDAGCLMRQDGEWQLVDDALLTAVTPHIPDTIHSPVLARMDCLPEKQRMALKVASVIGHNFEFDGLMAVLQGQTNSAALRQTLADLAERNFIRTESSSLYLFKHNIIQEVAYNTLPFERRRELHSAIAAWYEQSPDDEVVRRYPQMVHHWHHAENRERERVYAGLAGEQAAAQYANEEAERYLSRALALTDEGEMEGRYQLHLAREAIYDRLGLRETQDKELTELTALTAALGDHAKQAQVSLRRAFYERAMTQHSKALALIEQAISHAKPVGEITVEIQSYQLWGSILWQQGEYQLAQLKQEQALHLAQATDDRAQITQSRYNLGLVHYYEADFAAAQSHFEEAQHLYQTLDNRRGLVNCLVMSGAIENKVGKYLAAQESYEQALTLCREIGWRHGETFALNNLGNNYFELGEYEVARHYHEQVSLLCRMLGDQEGEAASEDTLGLAAHHLDEDTVAQAHYQRALTIQQEIGDRHGEAYTLTHLGYMSADREDWETAQTHLNRALALRSELGEAAQTQDDIAGLAHVAWAQNDLTAALAYVEEALAWIEAHDVEGIEFPVQVYLICYRVLQAAAFLSRAHTVLRQGYYLLQQRAEAIQDDHLRRQFLENVSFNREIVAAYALSRGFSRSLPG